MHSALTASCCTANVHPYQVHGKAFMEWQQETGALAADDSGLLLEIAARNMDTEQTQKRMEGLQIYCHKLERTVGALCVHG